MGNAVDWVKEQTVIGDVDDWVNEQTVMGDINDWLDDQGMEWLWTAGLLGGASYLSPGIVSGSLSSLSNVVGKVPLVGKTLAAPLNLASEGAWLAENALFGETALTGSGINTASSIAPTVASGTGANLATSAAGASVGPDIGAMTAADLVGGSAVTAPTTWGLAKQAVIMGAASGVGAGLANLALGAGAKALGLSGGDVTSTRTTSTKFPEGESVPQVSLPRYTAPTGKTSAPTLESPQQAVSQPTQMRAQAPAVEGSGLLASASGTQTQRAVGMDKNTTRYAKPLKKATADESLSSAMSKALAELSRVYGDQIPAEQMMALAENQTRLAKQMGVSV